MSNINDKATVALFVNGEQAEAAMDRLRQKAAALDKQLQAALAAGDAKNAGKLQKELDKVNKELNRVESAAKGTGIVLNSLSNSSMLGLKNALKHLRKELSMTRPDTEMWNNLSKQIQEVKGRIAELNEELEGSQSLWARFKTWADTAWPALDLLKRGYDSVVASMRGFVDAYAGMDQEMANVRKYTGLTAEQVEALNEEFKKIDTRTSREDLNKLAQEAGRLGKTSPEDIIGFVRAADKINVALDDLGDGATLTLSKLTGIFGDEKRLGTEKALLSVGSVINELSQNCSASAPYIAEFASRMGGVGSQAGMTVQQIMGFAAVLDSNNQKLEASSTALSQVITRIYRDPEKYAKVAGINTKHFAEIVKNDMNGALIELMEHLNRAGGMDVLSPMFADMGENGARAIQTLSTLASHIDEVKAQQLVANEAFAEAVSIDNEFDVQNNTVQAGIDKAKNKFHELAVELGQKLQPVMSVFISTTSLVARTLLTVINFVSQHIKVILAAGAAVTAYYVALNSAAIAARVKAAVTAKWNALIAVKNKLLAATAPLLTALKVGYLNLTGQVDKVTMAQKRMMVAFRSMPWGAAIAAVTAFVGVLGALSALFSKTKTQADILAEAERDLAEAENQAVAQCAAELTQLEALYNATQDQTLSMDQRLAAVNRLQNQYPDYFKNLSTEAILAGEAADAYKRLRDNIERSAKMSAAKELLTQIEKEIMEVTDDTQRFINEQLSEIDVTDGRQFSTPAYEGEYGLARGYVEKYPEFAIYRFNINHAEEKKREKVSELEARKSVVMKRVENLTRQELNENTQSEAVATVYHPSAGDNNNTKEDKFKAEKEWRQEQEALARISYATGKKNYIEYTDEMDAIAVEFYKKQLKHADLSELERLNIMADKAEAEKKQKEHTTAQSIDAQKEAYEDMQALLKEYYIRGLISKETYDQSTVEAEIAHQRKLMSLYEDGSKERRAAESRLQDLMLSEQQRKQKEQLALQKKYEEIKKKRFGDNAAEAKAKCDAELAALDVVYQAELRAAGDNAKEKLRIDKAYEEAKLAIKKEYNQEGNDDTRSGYEKAIDDSVKWLESDGGKAVTGTLNTISSGMSSIFTQMSSIVQAELEMQTAAINKRYASELEAAQGNVYKVKQLEKQKEKEIAKAKNEANKKMFAMQVIQAVAQTAQNALNAYGSAAAIPVVGHVMAPIAAAMAVAAGMIQVAAIKKQQQASESQGYSQGGFTKPGAVDEPAGIVHAGEWVASQKLLASPVARPMIDALDYAQRNNTIGSLRADDISRSIRANDSLVRIAEDNDSSAVMVAAFARNAQAVTALVERLNQPFVTVNTVTGDTGIKQAQDEYSRLMNNVTPKSKRALR